MAGNAIWSDPFSQVPDGEDHWGFRYGTEFKVALNENWGLGVEAYGRRTKTDEETTREHRIGPMLYFDLGKDQHGAAEHGNDEARHEEQGLVFHSGVGVLFGLTDQTNDITVKWSLEAEF